MATRKPQGYSTRQFGKYTLLERIGAGGMAEIFRAKLYGSHGFEKEVAIKKILPNLSDDSDFIDMFINEAKIMVGLVHNNIVQVLDLGQVEGIYYIGMEYVHGKDLLDLLARCAEMQLKVPLKLALFTVAEMLRGLDYAHKSADAYGSPLNIIHRDVSPSNVLLSYSGSVKVGDFGVAKARTQRVATESGTLKGKVGYMSPEQVRGDDIDNRSDLFAAGVILFEVLNMRRLFIGGSDLDVMLRVRDVDVDKELKSSIPLPEDLDAILRKALARTADTRYPTANAFHIDVMEFLYKHRLRVTNDDLAQFLGRVFEAELSQDKLRRQQFRDKEDLLRAAAHAGAMSDDVEVKNGARNPTGPKKTPVAPAPAPAVQPAEVVDESVFRYRDKSGLVFGPMSINTLTNLLVGTPLSDQDRIAEGNGQWQRLESMPAVKEQVLSAKAAARKKDTRDAEQSAGPRKSSVGLRSPSGLRLAPESSGARRLQSILSPSGTLTQSPFAHILFKIWTASANGTLTVEHDSMRKRISFSHGNPIAVTSNNDAELLGNFLVHEGILSNEALAEALERAKAFGGRLGDALVANRIIQSHVLFEYLFRQAKFKLFDVFTWQEGSYDYKSRSDESQPNYPLGINSLEVVLEGIKRHVPTEYLETYFHGRQHTPLRPNAEPRVWLDDLRLTAKQFRIATAATNQRTTLDALLRKLTTTSKIQQDDINRVLYLLIQLEIIGFIQQ